MREAFVMQKLHTFFQQKYWLICDINVWNFNDTLINDVVSFEQPGPGRRNPSKMGLTLKEFSVKVDP